MIDDIEKLQKLITTLKKDIDEWDRMWEELTRTHNEEVSRLRLENAKLTAELKEANQRIEDLEQQIINMNESRGE